MKNNEQNNTEKIGGISSKTMIILLIILTTMLGFIYKIDRTKYEQMVFEQNIPRTVLKIKNSSTEDSVLTYLTVGSDDRFITDVNGIFGITDSGTRGSFYMYKDSIYTYEYDGKGLAGNISFGTPPINCPTAEWKYGNNLFEVCINNYGTVTKAQETVDISNVAGCNAKGTYTMTGGGSWIANGKTVKTFYNDAIYKNFGKIGVYPFMCDDCTASVKPPVCTDKLKKARPQKTATCNISRDAKLSGGIIVIEFNGYTD